MAGQVEDAQVFVLGAPETEWRESNLSSIGRPVRICLTSCVLRQNGLWAAAFRRDDVAFRITVGEQDTGSVGRTTGIQGVHGRFAQLHRVASIPVGPPQDSLREGNVSHEPAVL